MYYLWMVGKEGMGWLQEWLDTELKTELQATRPSHHLFLCFCSSVGSVGCHHREMISLQWWTVNLLSHCVHLLLPLNVQQLFQINRLNQLSLMYKWGKKSEGSSNMNNVIQPESSGARNKTFQTNFCGNGKAWASTFLTPLFKYCGSIDWVVVSK